MKKNYLAMIFAVVVLSGIFAVGATDSVTVREEKIDPMDKKVTILLGPAVAIPGATTLYVIERKMVLQSEADKNPNATMEAIVSFDDRNSNPVSCS